MAFENFNYKPTEILGVEEYRSLYDVPDSENVISQNEMITKWLLGAQDQLNSISNNALYAGIDKLDPTIESDQKEFYIIKRCIGDWVEYFILTSRIFIDRTQNVQGSVPLDLTTQANDGDIEAKRLDILRKFALTRFYKTRVSQSSISINEPCINEIDVSKESWYSQLVTNLQSEFKTITNVNEMVGDLTFVNSKEFPEPNSIYNVGNIMSYAVKLPQEYWPTISGFNIDANLVGTVEQSNVSLGANKIYWKQTNEYLTIEEIPNLAFFGPNGSGFESAVSRQELYGFLENSRLPWNAVTTYGLDTIVRYIFEDAQGVWQEETYQSLIAGNLGNNPQTSPNVWRAIASASNVDYNLVIDEATTRTIANFNPLWTQYQVKVDTELATFKTYIETRFTEIENVLNDEFNKFTADIDNDIVNIRNSIPNQINLALDALPTIEYQMLIAKAGTWMHFRDEATFTEFATKYNLVERVDYFTFRTVFSDPDLYLLGYNDLQRSSGTALLLQNQLPKARINLANNYTGVADGRIHYKFDRAGSSSTSGAVPIVPGFWQTEGGSATTTYFIDLNPNQFQLPFIPRFGGAYIVYFIKDVFDTKTGLINPKNIPTVWGDIKGDIKNQNDLVSNFATLFGNNYFWATAVRGEFVFNDKQGVRLGQIRWEETEYVPGTINKEFWINSYGDLFLNAASKEINVLTNKLINVGAPTSDTDATNKVYVDTLTNTLRTDLGDLGNIVNSNTQKITTIETTLAKTKKYYTLETTVINRAGSMVNPALNFYGFLIGIDITTFTPLRGKIKSVWPKSEPLRKATILFDVPDTTRNVLWLNVIFNKTWADESFALNAAIILELEE